MPTSVAAYTQKAPGLLGAASCVCQRAGGGGGGGEKHGSAALIWAPSSHGTLYLDTGHSSGF